MNIVVLFLDFRGRILGVEKGTYVLVIALEREASVAVGKLGRFAFPVGYYIYVGSARGGLSQRVHRHLEGGGGEGSSKKLRWHIDYLLQHAKVVEMWYAENSHECLWATAVKEMPQCQIPVPGFGSSDCRCPSHLIYSPIMPSFELFRQMLEGQSYRAQKAPPLSFL